MQAPLPIRPLARPADARLADPRLALRRPAPGWHACPPRPPTPLHTPLRRYNTAFPMPVIGRCSADEVKAMACSARLPELSQKEW